MARNPSDPEAWKLLAGVDYGLKYVDASLMAVQQAADLDPMGKYAQQVVASQLNQALPSSSATRFPTPPPGR